jgi:hypothetical protein
MPVFLNQHHPIRRLLRPLLFASTVISTKTSAEKYLKNLHTEFIPAADF